MKKVSTKQSNTRAKEIQLMKNKMNSLKKEITKLKQQK